MIYAFIWMFGLPCSARVASQKCLFNVTVTSHQKLLTALAKKHNFLWYDFSKPDYFLNLILYGMW
jgi:hypothetical protein